MPLKVLVISIFVLGGWSVFAQKLPPGENSFFKKYDRSHITPEIRRKGGISLGGVAGFHTPFGNQIDNGVEPNFGFHLAYNHMYVRRRRLLMSQEGKTTDEFQSGWGVSVNVHMDMQALVYGYFYRPLIRMYTPIFRIYLINEYGLGAHYDPVPTIEGQRRVSPSFFFEPIRLKFSNTPIFFHLTGAYSFKNNILSKKPLNVSVLGGFRIYFYNYS